MHIVDRPIPEKSKSAIESKLSEMGDYVKISYLQRALKSGLSLDTRKFVLLRLSGIYEVKKMYGESARLVKSAGEINTTFKEKIGDYIKSVELYVKAGNYQEANLVFAQALALGNSKDKLVMKTKLKDFYLIEAKICYNNDKRNNARLLYEKILTLDLGVEEKIDVQKNLLVLYDKLGLIREYYTLKNSM